MGPTEARQLGQVLSCSLHKVAAAQEARVIESICLSALSNWRATIGEWWRLFCKTCPQHSMLLHHFLSSFWPHSPFHSISTTSSSSSSSLQIHFSPNSIVSRPKWAREAVFFCKEAVFFQREAVFFQREAAGRISFSRVLREIYFHFNATQFPVQLGPLANSCIELAF